jgi:hypothetical protein
VSGSGGDAPLPPPSPPPPPPPPPPPMPTMGQFVYLDKLSESKWLVVHWPLFFRRNSLVLDAREGSMASDDWVTSFEDLTDALRCTDEQKVDYAGLKLIGEARYWWKARKTFLIEELGRGVPIIWERFEKEFNDRF